MSTFKILSLDGGGVRGAFSAGFLTHCEKRLEKPIGAYFDLITGTSTGGIIALGLGTGKTASEIGKLYLERAKYLFARSLFRYGLFVSKYDGQSLEKQLRDFFGETLLGSANTRLCIPAVDLTNAQPKVFKTPHSRELNIDLHFPIWQIAMATSAAPTYFRPYRIGEYEFVDGGLWANNPSMVGIIEALKLGAQFEHIEVLSIGTGHEVFSARRSISRRGGIASWRRTIIDLNFLSQVSSADFTAKLTCGKANVVRVEHALPSSGEYQLDSAHSVSKIHSFGSKQAENQFEEIRQKFFSSVAEPPTFYNL